jgi:hypothetical protein
MQFLWWDIGMSFFDDHPGLSLYNNTQLTDWAILDST